MHGHKHPSMTTHSKNAAQMLVFVNNQNTVAALCGHELSSLNDQHVLFHCKGLSWSESRNGASNLLSRMPNSRTASTFLGKLLLKLLTNGLMENASTWQRRIRDGGKQGIPHLSCSDAVYFQQKRKNPVYYRRPLKGF